MENWNHWMPMFDKEKCKLPMRKRINQSVKHWNHLLGEKEFVRVNQSVKHWNHLLPVGICSNKIKY